MATEKITLEVNEEQKSAIMIFLQMNNWQLDISSENVTTSSNGNYHCFNILIFNENGTY